MHLWIYNWTISSYTLKFRSWTGVNYQWISVVLSLLIHVVQAWGEGYSNSSWLWMTSLKFRLYYNTRPEDTQIWNPFLNQFCFVTLIRLTFRAISLHRRKLSPWCFMTFFFQVSPNFWDKICDAWVRSSEVAHNSILWNTGRYERDMANLKIWDGKNMLFTLEPFDYFFFLGGGGATKSILCFNPWSWEEHISTPPPPQPLKLVF